MIWTARLRTGRVVIFRASGSRAFRAVALIASVAAVDLADSAVIAAAVEVDLAVIDLVAAGDLGAVALAASAAAVAGSGADAEKLMLGEPWLIFIKSHVNKTPKGRAMRKLSTLTGIAGFGAVLTLMAACQTVATNNAELAASKKEFLLAQSGFKVITVTTPKQQQAINGLTQYRVSAVKYNGKLYYVFPTATKDKIYVGRQKQYDAYKGALQAHLASHPAAQQAQPGQQLMNPAPTMTYETAGPQHIEVEQFDGFGPMGTASLGDW